MGLNFACYGWMLNESNRFCAQLLSIHQLHRCNLRHGGGSSYFQTDHKLSNKEKLSLQEQLYGQKRKKKRKKKIKKRKEKEARCE